MRSSPNLPPGRSVFKLNDNVSDTAASVFVLCILYVYVLVSLV